MVKNSFDDLIDLKLEEVSSNVKDSTNVIRIVAVCGMPIFGVQELRGLLLKELKEVNEIENIELNLSEERLSHDLSNLKVEMVDLDSIEELQKMLARDIPNLKPQKPADAYNLSRLNNTPSPYFRPIKTISCKNNDIPKRLKFKARNNC